MIWDLAIGRIVIAVPLFRAGKAGRARPVLARIDRSTRAWACSSLVMGVAAVSA